MPWPPTIGDPLPRAAKAWCERGKLEGWVLGAEGHGAEWERVFRVGVKDADRVWKAIADAVLSAPITELRERGHGVGCGVLVELAIDARVAPVLTGWHYADEKAAPRLVTAYPKPYNRGHGNGA